jgi:sulfur carrier protein ThiS
LSDTEGVVKAIYGANNRSSSAFIGKTVGSVRGELATAFNIPPGAVAKVHGEPVPEDHILENGDVLEFTKPAGNRVVCGSNVATGEYVGVTVGELRRELRDELNIADKAVARVNGNNVVDTYVMKKGDTLEFVRQAGTKG